MGADLRVVLTVWPIAELQFIRVIRWKTRVAGELAAFYWSLYARTSAAASSFLGQMCIRFYLAAAYFLCANRLK